MGKVEEVRESIEAVYRKEKGRILRDRVIGCRDDLYSYSNQMEEVDKGKAEKLRRIAGEIDDLVWE